jgi:hypothetical protein
MSDIFISYSSEERHRVLPLVNALEKTGWSVFWDRTIPAGKTWRQVIGTEIQTCRSVVVVWTESSVRSEWVLEEAETGKRRQILIPVLLDEVEPPFGFGTIQAANLTAWDREYASRAFARFIGDISVILGPAPSAMKEAEEHRRAEDEARRNRGNNRLRHDQSQQSAEEARRETNQKKPEITEDDAHRGCLRTGQQTTFDGEQAGSVCSETSPHPPRAVSFLECLMHSLRRQFHRFGFAALIVGAPVLAFWLIDLSGTKDAKIEKIASLEIHDESRRNNGGKTALRAETSSEDSQRDVIKGPRWDSRTESVAVASKNSQPEASIDESADVSMRNKTTANPQNTLLAKQATPDSEADMAKVTTLPGFSQSTEEKATRKRAEETKRNTEQQRRQTKIAELVRKTEESKKPAGIGATLRSAEAAGRVVNVRNVMTTDAGKVSGEVVNNSNQTLRDVRLQILYSWRWKDEHRPGKDDPGKAIYHVLGQEIPPSQTIRFNYEPSPPFAVREDGQFDIGVKIVGFAEVFQDNASK